MYHMNAAEAQRIRLERGRVNHKTYRMIFDQIRRKIRAQAAMKETSLTTKVPLHVPGRPPFDHSHAIRYVCEKLRLGKYDVQTYHTPNGCYIEVSWKAAKPAPRPSRTTPRPARTPRPAPEAPRNSGGRSRVMSSKDINDRLDRLLGKLSRVA